MQNPAFDEMAELFLLVLLISHTSRGWRTRAARQPLVYLFLVYLFTYAPYLGFSLPSRIIRTVKESE